LTEYFQRNPINFKAYQTLMVLLTFAIDKSWQIISEPDWLSVASNKT